MGSIFSHHAEILFLAFFLLFAMIFCPAIVLMRFLNPCNFFRFLFLG